MNADDKALSTPRGLSKAWTWMFWLGTAMDGDSAGWTDTAFAMDGKKAVFTFIIALGFWHISLQWR